MVTYLQTPSDKQSKQTIVYKKIVTFNDNISDGRDSS